MAGTLRAKVYVFMDDFKYELDLTPGTTKLYGQTIPTPYRKRIDASLRSILISLKELPYEDQEDE